MKEEKEEQQKLWLWYLVSTKVSFYSEKVQFIFQISKSQKKLFQKTILRLKFKIPANNISILGARGELGNFCWFLEGLKAKQIEICCSLSKQNHIGNLFSVFQEFF